MSQQTNLLDLQLAEVKKLFQFADEKQKGYIDGDELLQLLEQEGILRDDPRINKILDKLKDLEKTKRSAIKISEAHFEEIVQHNLVLKNALVKNHVIPDFYDFYQDIKEIFEETQKNTSGKVADYIPQLARVEPEQFAVSVCTIDGQRFSLGDAQQFFCLQSSCKPISYCLSIREHGVDKVHNHVGREPSGKSFNELSLNDNGLPHNPLINAGAIMTTSLIKPNLVLADRFEYVFNVWKQLCAGKRISFNNSVYLSERATADRNFALAYFMRENNAFPEKTNLIETLEFYFQTCSIESCTSHLSIAAATLANAGVNPLTGEKIFNENIVQHCMSLMLSCGMYDFSGEFAFKIGVPAKSGVSGILFIVIPNVMGITVWSPRLDKHGNSVRGVEFCERLIEKYNFHNYDSLTKETSKKNPRKHKHETKVDQLMNLIYAASHGDIDEVRRLEAMGADLSQADYDGRTAIHLAASENQVEVVRYLISRGVPLDPVDRWGNTPLDDARRENFSEMIELLENGMKPGSTQKN